MVVVIVVALDPMEFRHVPAGKKAELRSVSNAATASTKIDALAEFW